MTEDNIKAYVHSLPPRIFGLETIETLECARLDKGLHHLNFKLDISDGFKKCQAVLRLAGTTEDYSRLINEVWYLKKVGEGIAPKVLYHADTSALEMPVVITAFAAGVHLDFNNLDDTHIARLAEKLAAVHAIKDTHYSIGDAALPATRGTYRDYARSAIYEALTKPYNRAKKIPHDKVIVKACEALEQKLNSPDPSWSQDTFSLGHGDVGIYNVLWSGHDLCLIDWDGARFGDPADDIAYIFAINHVSKQWQATFLDAYFRASKSKDVASRIETYLLKNYIQDVVWAIGKILEEQEGRSLVRLEKGAYQAMYERRLAALKTTFKYLR
jgi:thiamine kinase-like enzyme